MRRRYALFEKVDGKWVRRSEYAYFKASAVQLFQGTLISTFFEGKNFGLRPVPTCSVCENEIREKPPRKLCGKCEDRALRAMASTTSEVHDA